MTTSFDARLAERFAAARQQDEARRQEDQELMRERSERLAVLEREGERVHRTVIRPRAEAFARHLPARVEHYRTATGFHTFVRCAHTDTFPATAKLGLGVEWSAEADAAWLVCSVEIIPVLMALPGDARLELEWEGPDDAEAGRWVEDRALQFAEACLAIMRDPHYQADNVRIDPVCGMRVTVAGARGATEYGGKRYAFCSEACAARFAAAPELYLQGRMDLGAESPNG